MSVSDRIPYPGLRAFDPSESDLFFGREGCVDEMLDLLSNTKFLAVLGTSGSGKSSLVRTGLLDSLELGFLQGTGSRWLIADMHPGGRPLHNMAKSVDGARGSSDQSSVAMLESFLSRGPRSLVKWCEDGNLPEGHSLLLLVDQFEELFRYQDYAGQEKAEAFVALLLECIKSDLPIFVVITMRSEYLGACALMPGLAERINRSLYLTRRMTREECKQAIEGPAAVLDFAIEPKLVNRILNDLATFAPWDSESTGGSLAQLARRADQLPLMQHVLNRLWLTARNRGDACVLLHSDYEALGGLRGAIDAHAEEVIATLPAEYHDKVQTTFQALIAGNTVTDAVRNPLRFEDLAANSDDPDAVKTIVEAFRADGCNFLRPSTERSVENGTIIDLGHESLIRQWSRMEVWLANESRSRAIWRRLVASTEAHLENEGDLLSGLDLDNARDWWNRTQPSESWARNRGGDFVATRAFLDASIQTEEAHRAAEASEVKRAQRSLKIRAAAFMILSVIGVGAAAFALDARNDAVEAKELAEGQRQVAEWSQKLTLEAADTLLIDVATQFRRSIGVPRSKVESMFTDADTFLKKIEAQIGDPRQLYAPRAALALERARDAWNRAEFDTATEHVDTARMAIESARTPSTFSADDVDKLLSTMSFEYWRHNHKDQREEARAALDEIDEFLALHRATLRPNDAQYWDAVMAARRATASVQDKEWEQAFEQATACVDGLKAIMDPSFRARAAQMRCTARRLGVAQELELQDPSLIADAQSALNLIDDADKSRNDWNVWDSLQDALVDAANNQGDFDTADRLQGERIQRFQNLWAAEPEEDDWAVSVAGGHLTRGFYFGRRRINEKAYDAALKSAETYKKLSDTFEDWPGRAKNYAIVLNNLRIYMSRLEDRHRDPTFLHSDVEWKEERLRILDFMVENEIEKECNGCTFEQLYLILLAHAELFKLGEVDAGDAMIATYDRLVDRGWDHMVDNRLDLEANMARYRISASSQNLAAFVNQAIGEIPDGEAVRLSGEIVPRVERYLERFPRDLYVRQILGDHLAVIAELHVDAGQEELAVATMRRAMKLGSHDAHLKMLDWHQTGEGPIDSDPSEVKALQLALETVAPGPFNIFLSGKSQLVEAPNTAADRVNLFAPDDAELSAVDEVAWRSRMLGGHEIDDAEIARLRDYETVAKDKGIPFSIAVLQERSQGTDEVVYGMSVDDHLNHFYERLPAPGAEVDKGNRALVTIVTASVILETRETATQAILRIVRDREHPNYDNALKFVGFFVGNLSSYHHPNAKRNGANFVEGRKRRERDLIAALAPEFDAMPPTDVAKILNARGSFAQTHGKPGVRHLGAQDIQAAILLAPDNPTILNAAAYAWLDQPHLRSIAVNVLERALSLLEPGTDDHNDALDSLGWGYVLTGRFEEGRALLAQVIETRRTAFAIHHYHLAEAYRRLDRTEDALAEIAIASSLATGDPEFEEKVRQFFRDIDPDRTYVASEIEAAKRVAEEIQRIKLNRKTVSMDAAGIAIRGYDPVALHKAKEPRIGRLEHFVVWNDAIWLFEDAENRDAFEAAPKDFAPIGGGFVPQLDVTRRSLRFHGSPHHGVVLGEKLVLSGKDERKRLEELGSDYADLLEVEWERADHPLDMPPSAPSIYEHMLKKLLE